MAKQTFAESMREDRVDLGLTQKQFAGLIGVSQGDVSAYELDLRRPSKRAMKEIERLLGKQPATK